MSKSDIKTTCCTHGSRELHPQSACRDIIFGGDFLFSAHLVQQQAPSGAKKLCSASCILVQVWWRIRWSCRQGCRWQRREGFCVPEDPPCWRRQPGSGPQGEHFVCHVSCSFLAHGFVTNRGEQNVKPPTGVTKRHVVSPWLSTRWLSMRRRTSHAASCDSHHRAAALGQVHVRASVSMPTCTAAKS
jgi:hypothetical protein